MLGCWDFGFEIYLTMPRDYYETLGVARGASADEVKKAFRKKAHELHPDKRGGDEAKFKELNEAYQALSDSSKRQTYDQFGHDGARFSGGGAGRAGNPFGAGGVQFDFGQGADLNDLFGSFFGNAHRSGRGTSAARSARQSGADVEAQLTVTLAEAASGAKRRVQMDVAAMCERCKGSGGEPGSGRATCATCKGSGAVNSRQDTFMGSFQTSSLCSTCNGEGTTVSAPCRECSGQGRVRRRRTLDVTIPAGIADGQTLRLQHQGEAGLKGGHPGDLYVTVRVTPHPKLTRDGDSMRCSLHVTIRQATLGDTVTVPTIEGEAKLKIPAGTQSNTILKMAGKGMPHLHRSGRGDQLVTVHVRTPDKLTKEQRRALEDLF